MRRSRLANTLVALACAAALGLVACGGDDDGGTGEQTATTETLAVATEPDLERYCELVTELDRRSAEVFNELGAEGVPTDAELGAAQQQVLDENAELIDELARVTPEEIADDFELTLESARERAAAGDAASPPREVADAGERLQKFRRENCPQPSGG